MKKDLEQLFNEYISYCTYTKRLRSATIKGYKEAFGHLRKLVPEIRYPDDIKDTSLNTFFKLLETRKRLVGRGEIRIGVRLSTVKTYWSKINSYFEWLVISKHLSHNPLQDMKPPNPTYEDKRALLKDDVNKIITAISLNNKNIFLLKRDTAIFYTLIFTGLRKGELLGLEVRDVDLSKRSITIRGETSKSKTTRIIPINQTLLLHLSEYLEARKKYKTPSLFVSNNSDRGISEGGLIHWIRKYKDLTGMKFHLHRFRHTFACALGRNNSSAIKIQKLMGHTDLRMTQRYLRSMGIDDLREDVDNMNIDIL